MAVNSITFNGINSLDYGLYVSGDKTFNSSEKDYSKVSVPGRSGDLLIFNNRFKNVNQTYNAILIEDYYKNTEMIRSWLLSANGYCRLEDTYHPDEFRLASFSGPIEFDTMLLEAGETSLTFDCKPQRWLKIGENKILITPENNNVSEERNGSKDITNPTIWSSKPLLRVYGTGTFLIGTGEITIVENSGEYIDIDCDIMDCYEGSINRNNNVIISKWPELTKGKNKIIFTNGSLITKIYVTPRWWII